MFTSNISYRCLRQHGCRRFRFASVISYRCLRQHGCRRFRFATTGVTEHDVRSGPSFPSFLLSCPIVIELLSVDNKYGACLRPVILKSLLFRDFSFESSLPSSVFSPLDLFRLSASILAPLSSLSKVLVFSLLLFRKIIVIESLLCSHILYNVIMC
jgi:hypothetical protein